MEVHKPDYDIAEFSRLNKQRSDEVFKAGKKEISYFILAMTEELGEVAGALKKLQRGFTNRDYLKLQKKLTYAGDEAVVMMGLNYTALQECTTLEQLYKDYPATANALANIHYLDLKEKFAKELADLFGYMDLTATNLGINLWEAIKQKFNQVSDEMNCDFKI